MTILISKIGKITKKLDKSSFKEESSLQKFIYDNPDSIPLYEIKEDIRLLIVAKEFSTRSGSIDALGFDDEGDIYLIETKLYKNPDKRLVVAQVLDYGASLWKDDINFDDFIGKIEKHVMEKFKVNLNQKIKDFFGLDDDEISVFKNNIRKNLNEGKFKFVVLMDRVQEELKNLIIFLNQNSKFDLFAVEIEYYKYEDYDIVIPKLYGAEVKKDIGVASSSERGNWDEQSFFEDARKRLNEKELKALIELYDFSKENADEIRWGTGTARGSFNVKFYKISNKSIYSVFSEGTIHLNFGWLHDNEETKKYRDMFKSELDKIGLGHKIPNDYDKKYPVLRIKDWQNIVYDFINAIKNLISK